MKAYIVLAISSVILFILAASALTVAVGLLTHETAKGVVEIYNVVVEGAVDLRDSWMFVRSVGAF